MKFFANLFVESLSQLVCRLPISAQFRIGDALGCLWFDILRIRRKVALDNLKACFGEKSEEERLTIARSSVYHIGRSFVEFLRIPAIAESREQRDYWRQKFTIHGEDNLKAALAKGHGVFLLTAHVGNGDWATAGMALSGYHIHVITKEIKLGWLNTFWFETRQSLGTDLIADRNSSLAILKLMKKNQIVAFMLDQFLGPPIGIKTQFFGRETGTAMGLALLAGRSQAAVVPAYSYRDPDGMTHVVFEPEIPFVEGENKDETMTKMTQAYCDRIETWVRKIPEQWMWVHRRWKTFKY
jgi:KDO2-lipid IV(A) lauroyltransferase